MLNALVWMFKTKDFKNHFFYLLKILLACCFLSVLAAFLSTYFNDNNQFISKTLFIFVIIFPAFAVLAFQGYFWELTECVIDRKVDIVSSNIYNKMKLKEVYKINLPEIHLKQFVWRGIASIIATILLIYPLVMLLLTSLFTSGDFKFSDISQFDMLTYSGLYIFIGLFIPALLWNYARRNSIFAVWNLPKAIHIMGTYPIRYFCNTLLFLLLVGLQNFISIFLANILSIPSNFDYSNADIILIAKTIIYFIAIYIMYTYWIFVNAYLLGTVAPSEEA